ncbi:MAG TPA: S-adenosylmethionine synthetase N-terminal domain-containing protein, partial [Streptosporangiaceae bacterium]|nr:S-adenosylmethionine synthetase N-terminal domain-containing protein [Streptosporangiaceae bacterium]
MAELPFTSESVTEGHPDKVADQISDAILDEMLRRRPRAHAAIETMVTTGSVHVTGEATERLAEAEDIIRRTIRRIGYDSSMKGFDADTCAVSVSISGQ